MDLSPGSPTWPFIDVARDSLISIIIAITRHVCLDRAGREPLTYRSYVLSEIREISLPSRLESVDEAATIADEFAKGRSLDEEFISAIDLAIRESVANAVKHGNKLDETKNVDVTLSDSTKAFEITVRDFGSGFDVDNIADATAPENLLKTNGRGILFMRSFMDEVEWLNADGGGLIVRMSKSKAKV